MISGLFFIDGQKLSAHSKSSADEAEPFYVKSVPHNYRIEWLNKSQSLVEIINQDPGAIVLADAYFKENYLSSVDPRVPAFFIEATENNKNIQTAIEFAEFLNEVGTTKLNVVYVIGGGVLQDVGAFACAMYKRGIPWTYVPTTLLGMADSCIGGKTGLNHAGTKNLMALFAAPHRIIHDLEFLNTLPRREMLAGFGEALRLHVTGGDIFLTEFEKNIDLALSGDVAAIKTIIMSSLAVKRAVVEEDEFENSIRRSMNYGHSVGHALEALTNFAFPHGMAVSLGIVIENNMAKSISGFDAATVNRIEVIARKIIDKEARDAVNTVSLNDINLILKRDKKTLGNVLKLAIPEKLGSLVFADLSIDEKTKDIVQNAISEL